jgi:hypothetical protein
VLEIYKPFSEVGYVSPYLILSSLSLSVFIPFLAISCLAGSDRIVGYPHFICISRWLKLRGI